MKTLSKVVTCQKQKDLYILNKKNSGIIPSILCHMPSSVELLRLTTPRVETPRFQTRLTSLQHDQKDQKTAQKSPFHSQQMFTYPTLGQVKKKQFMSFGKTQPSVGLLIGHISGPDVLKLHSEIRRIAYRCLRKLLGLLQEQPRHLKFEQIRVPLYCGGKVLKCRKMKKKAKTRRTAVCRHRPPEKRN